MLSAFDLSGDGLTTPLDALWVVNAINQSTPAAALPAADLNSDNQIDPADADLAIGLVAAVHQQNLASWIAQTETAAMQNPEATLSASQVDASIGLLATVASFDAASDNSGPADPMFASSTDLNDASCEALLRLIEQLQGTADDLNLQISALDHSHPAFESTFNHLYSQMMNTMSSISTIQARYDEACGSDSPSGPTSPSGPSPSDEPEVPTGPTMPSGPSWPSGPSIPSGPSWPSGPTMPSGPSWPTGPSTPSVPSSPTGPTSSTGPSTPTGPTSPTGPTLPTVPTTPSTPSGPTSPPGPSSPTGPSSPSGPSNPTNPTNPTSPSIPTTPNEPTTPTNPTNPSGPTAPTGPTAPSAPTAPSTPATFTLEHVEFGFSGPAGPAGSTEIPEGSDLWVRGQVVAHAGMMTPWPILIIHADLNSNGIEDLGEKITFYSELDYDAPGTHNYFYYHAGYFYAYFDVVDDGPSENPDGTPGNGTPRDAFNITVTLVGYDVEILAATALNVAPVFTAHPSISITYDETGKRVAVAEVSAIHDPGIHDHHSLALQWPSGESNTAEMRCVTNIQSCTPNDKTGRIASIFPESFQSAFPLNLLLTDDDTAVASYRIEKLNVLRSSTAGDVPGQNGETFLSQASSASTSLRGLDLRPFLSTAMDAETGVFKLIYGDHIRLWDSPDKHRIIVSGSFYQTDFEGTATTTYTGQETVWVEGVAAGQTEITLAWFPDSQYSTAGATSVLAVYAGTVIVQLWEALLEVKAISDGPLQGAEFVEETEDHLVFTTDALFEVAAFIPPEAEISGDVLVEVFADDLLVEQFSFTVSPGGEYRYPIVVPALNRSTLNVRASLVQDQGVVEEEEQPVVGLELKIGGSQLNATLTTAQLQELADSQVNKGFQAMFESLAERDSSIAMIINENDNIGTPEQAEAHYDQGRNQIARRLADGIKPHLDDVVEGLFAEKKPLMINVGKAKEQQANGLKEHWDSIGSRLDQQKLPEAFSIDFIDKDDILGTFRSALKETIDAKLIGQDVNFDTFLNQHLQWKEIEFVKGIGFKLPFDLLPGQTNNPLGTLFLGTGGFSVNSFGPDWKDNQSLKINITQPLMEWENKRLSFEVGGGYKFNGELDGGITKNFEARF